MKLDHLHVAQHGAGPISHRIAITDGDGRIGRLAIDAAAPAAGKDDGARPEHLMLIALVKRNHAESRAAACENIDRETVLEDAQSPAVAGALRENARYLASGGVAIRMNDA